MTRGISPKGLPALLAAILMIVAAWPASAQPAALSPRPVPQMPPPDDSPRDLRLVRIDVGAGDGGFRTGFIPVRVWLTSRVRSHNAVISVRTTQDSTQEAVVRVNATTTPGVVTPHDLLVSINARAERLEVVIDSDERSIRRSLGRVAGTDDSLPPPANDSLNLLIVGDVPAAATTLSQPDPQQPPSDKATPGSPWRYLTVSVARPDELYLAWLAYDCVDAVVTTPDALSKADPRAKASLLQWVEGGGSLLLVAADPGSLWRVPWTGRDDLPVTLHEAAEVACAADLVTRLRTQSFETAVASQEGDPVTFTTRTRTLSLTDEGRSNGWRLHLATEGDQGLVATGPYGAGRIGIIAADPQRLAPTLSVEAAKTVYRFATATIVPSARIEDLRWAGANGAASAFNPFAQVAFESSQSAVTTALNADTGDIPPVSPWSLLAIVIIAAALGLLVGPIDGYLVRRRSRRGATTWLTAMGWIGMATILAVALPLIMRSGRTTINSSESVDVLVDDPSRPGRQWSTMLVALFADGPIEGRIQGLPEGSWVRGVSANDRWWGDDDISLSPLRITLSTGSDGTPRATLDDIDQGQWTLRTLLARSPGRESAIRATVGDGDRATIAIDGLGSCSVAGTGVLRSPLGDFTLSFEPVDGGILAIVGSFLPPAKPKRAEPADWWSGSYATAESELLSTMPGFDRRTDSLMERIRNADRPSLVLEGRFNASSSPLSIEGVDPSVVNRHHVVRVRVAFPAEERFIGLLEAIKAGSSAPPSKESP